MKSQQDKLFKELLEGSKCITGFELNQLVEAILNREESADETDEYHNIAEQLWSDYFSNMEGVFKPAKFAYYFLEPRENGYVCKRNTELSPRGTDYFVSEPDSSRDYIEGESTLRTLISNSQRILGSDLKHLIDQTMEHLVTEETLSFTNFSVQLAEYLKTYYMDDNGLKDNIWYWIKTKEYGTLIVLRDLKRSPRTYTHDGKRK